MTCPDPLVPADSIQASNTSTSPDGSPARAPAAARSSRHCSDPAKSRATSCRAWISASDAPSDNHRNRVSCPAGVWVVSRVAAGSHDRPGPGRAHKGDRAGHRARGSGRDRQSRWIRAIACFRSRTRIAASARRAPSSPMPDQNRKEGRAQTRPRPNPTPRRRYAATRSRSRSPERPGSAAGWRSDSSGW